MARDMTRTGPTRTAPVWMGDFASRDYIVPGGAKLDAAQFAADAAGRKPVASGTIIGRTIAERDAGTGFGPALDTDDEIFILAFDVDDAAHVADADLYRRGGVVKENFLPGFAAATANLKAKVRGLYICTIGAE